MAEQQPEVVPTQPQQQQQEQEQGDASKKRKAEEEPTDCKFYLKGACKFGDRCRNRHDKKQKVNGGPVVKILEPAVPGVDSGREPCRWLKRGVCKFGSRCRNVHPPGLLGRPQASSVFHFSPFPPGSAPPPSRSRRPPRPGSDATTSQGTSGQLCKFYARGDCKFGERCRSIHSTDGGSGASTGGYGVAPGYEASNFGSGFGGAGFGISSGGYGSTGTGGLGGPGGGAGSSGTSSFGYGTGGSGSGAGGRTPPNAQGMGYRTYTPLASSPPVSFVDPRTRGRGQGYDSVPDSQNAFLFGATAGAGAGGGGYGATPYDPTSAGQFSNFGGGAATQGVGGVPFYGNQY